MTGLRWFKGKQLVSFLRNGDYAHAGEEEAILITMSKFEKNKQTKILDVGCGQGGTANFIWQNGWGKVTGIDIEESSIDYAKAKYPNVEFLTSDVMLADSTLTERKFDIICLYNAFYAFNNQEKALRVLRSLADDQTKLVIYEYTDLCDGINPFLDTQNNKAVSIPVKLGNLVQMLENTGWKLLETVDVSNKYIEWYTRLLEKLEANKSLVIQNFGQEKYQQTLKRYSDIRQYLVDKKLGGGIFYIDV